MSPSLEPGHDVPGRLCPWNTPEGDLVWCLAGAGEASSFHVLPPGHSLRSPEAPLQKTTHPGAAVDVVYSKQGVRIRLCASAYL